MPLLLAILAPGVAAAEPTSDRVDEERIVPTPMGGWVEGTASCRVLLSLRSSSEGCTLGVRRGRIAYVHAGLGFYETPQFERYLRYDDRDPEDTFTEDEDLPSVTIIDSTQSMVYNLEVGPGVAMWATRQFNVHLEGGGSLGIIANRASPVMQTADSDGFVIGAFAGVGLNYRLPSRPVAFGLDYRIQTVSYGGVARGASIWQEGVEVGHTLVGYAHSIGLTAIVRFEYDDRSN